MKIFTVTTFILSVLFSSFAHAHNEKSVTHDNHIIRLATTTSTENSGLLRFLLNAFEKDTSHKVHVISVGTGKALRMGKDGDVDLVLVHAINEEKQFIKNGFGVKRVPVMHNDFILVGPKDDPAQLVKTKTATQALQQIFKKQSRFVSRGDDSGTHKKELVLWHALQTSINEKSTYTNLTHNKWYLEAGQGMGKVLQMADELNAYTLSDRGTWLSLASKLQLKIVFQGDAALFNPYSIIAINPKLYPDVNHSGANTLIKWITSMKGQALIANYKISGKVLFTPSVMFIAKQDL